VRAALPLACAACRARLEAPPDAARLPLCAACHGRLADCGPPFCLTCAGRGGEPRACVEPGHLRLRAAWTWCEPVRALVHAAKFGDAPEVCAALVAAAWDTPAFAARPRPDVLVPVPLHAVRRRERGYDQAALLAREFADRAGAPDAAALRRTRPTRQQARLGRAARRDNVAGAFAAVRPRLVEGRRVALVDDVVTTGATLEACLQALRHAGARSVEAWCLAYEPLE
jgi:ComF family protein